MQVDNVVVFFIFLDVILNSHNKVYDVVHERLHPIEFVCLLNFGQVAFVLEGL
jgi:hypothetical protein